MFKCLIKLIYDENTTYLAGPNKWRINYTKTKMFAGSLEEEELASFEDAAKIQVDLYDATEGKVCVAFTRQAGASAIFYEQFNKFQDALSKLYRENK